MRTTLDRFMVRRPRLWCICIGISLVLRVAGAEAQGSGAVAGRVTDARSESAVAGASVTVEGTRLVGITAADGRYRIGNLPAGTHTLSVQSIGYAVQKRSVTVAGAALVADFALQPAPIQLEQVVVSGTAAGERVRAIGNSVVRVNAAEAVALGAPPTVQALLNARAPGVTINFNTGRVGAGPSINVRGRSSIGQGNSPLIYVDGVRVNSDGGIGPSFGGFSAQGAAVGSRLNDINPEDIESIEIIKGPAAATIYGTEASNGVIQIITKKGSSGLRPTFTLQVQQGALWFGDAENRLPTNYFRNRTTSAIETWNAVKAERDSGRVDLFKTGRTQGISGSVSGGVDQVRYYISSSFQDDTGIEPNNANKQFSLHANVNLTPSPKLDIATSLNFVDVRGRLGTDNGASTMLGSIGGHPQLYNAPGVRGFAFGFPPEVTWELWDNQQFVRRFAGSGTITHQPTNWLSQRFLAGIDYTAQDLRGLERFAPPELARFLTPAAATGRIGQSLRNTSRFSLDYSGSARANLMSSLTATSSIGLQTYRDEVDQSALGGLGFPGAGVYTISATATPLTPSQIIQVNTTVGGYFQEKLAWRDRLFVTGALRVDNNSAFGEDFKWVTYPKFDVSWVASDENFWTPLRNTIGTFRLRAAYGESGKAPNTFAALQTFSPVQGPGGTNAVTPGSLGNPDLKPERGKEIEVGFEAAVFDRLSVDFTYFTKKTVDQIVNQPVAPSSGFPGSIPLNLARVDNWGFELMTTLDALRSSDLQWDITGTLAVAKDEIKDLGITAGPVTTFSTGGNNREGTPISGWFARKIVSAERNTTTNLAQNVLCDNGDGGTVACATAPFLFTGRSLPTHTAALSNTLTIKRRLRLYALLDYQGGNKVFNANDELRCTGGFGGGLCEANYYPEKYDPVYLAQTVGTALSQGLVQDFLEDASFVKLREVSATYTLPERWLRGLNHASISVVARELATWTDYTGIDPDVANFIDQGVVPQLSRVNLIFNVRF